MGDVKVLEDKLRLVAVKNALKCKCEQRPVVYESILFYFANRTDCVKYARMQFSLTYILPCRDRRYDILAYFMHRLVVYEPSGDMQSFSVF